MNWLSGETKYTCGLLESAMVPNGSLSELLHSDIYKLPREVRLNLLLMDTMSYGVRSKEDWDNP